MTNIGWVDANSAEGQSVLNDPSNYSTVVVQAGDGYWYTQDANGYQYLWTTSGWMPAAGTTETTDPNTGTVGPPTAGDSEAALIQQVYDSGDPALIDFYQDLQETKGDMIEIVLNPGGEPDKPLSDDWDRDSISNSSDYAPYDYNVQDPIDVPPDDTDY